MNAEVHAEISASAPLGFQRDTPGEPPMRVVEYVGHASAARVEPWPRAQASTAERPVRALSRLPPWLARLLLVWGVLTLVSLFGPCHPLSPSPALTAEASP